MVVLQSTHHNIVTVSIISNTANRFYYKFGRSARHSWAVEIQEILPYSGTWMLTVYTLTNMHCIIIIFFYAVTSPDTFHRPCEITQASVYKLHNEHKFVQYFSIRYFTRLFFYSLELRRALQFLKKLGTIERPHVLSLYVSAEN